MLCFDCIFMYNEKKQMRCILRGDVREKCRWHIPIKIYDKNNISTRWKHEQISF